MKTDIVYRSHELNVHEIGNLTRHRFFSHGNFYDSDRVQFGTLRLLNNNHYTGPGRFGQQYQNDLEVILIPLTGSIEYTDSRSHRCIVKKDHVLTLSTGAGICYAVNSADPKEEVNYLKIWILPRKRGLNAKHQVTPIDVDMLSNRFEYIVTPDTAVIQNVGNIHQDAWVAISKVDPKTKMTYHKKMTKNGVFIHVCEGSIKVRGHVLFEGDCIAFDDKNDVVVEGVQDNRFLLLEVPMDVTLYNDEEKIIIPPKM